MKQYKITAYYIVALLVLIISACSKMDDYKTKFMSGGAIIYTGRMDSVKIFSGRNRVQVNGLFTSDPKIVKYRVFWNSRQDSIEVPVKRTTGVDTAKLIINNLPEGLMSFEIRTYDAQGRSSVAVNVAANVYGDIYQAGITNRPIADASMQSDGSALITWSDVNADAGIKSMEIKYTDNNNKLHDTIIPSVFKNLITSLPNFKANINSNSFSYNTLYLPTSTAIDKFTTAFQTQGVKFDITSLYLSNTGPFTRNTTIALTSNRWGTLAAPWVTNAAAKNKGGVNGGYTTDNGGTITWETYGNTPVVDGIIYQPTSSALPAGTYVVSFDEYSEIQTNSSVYCVAAAGGSGIPVLANLTTNALGFAALFNGAVIGTAAPTATDTRTFKFTLATSQVVSIGVLGNVLGGNNSGIPRGNYFRISKIQLFKY